jgi:hypothetical protein
MGMKRIEDMEGMKGMETACRRGAFRLQRTLFKTQLSYKKSYVMKILSYPMRDIVMNRDPYSDRGCN